MSVDTRTTDASPKDQSTSLPLSGVRVLELGQLIAGPFSGQFLGAPMFTLKRDMGNFDGV